jgi:hypothetical protein
VTEQLWPKVTIGHFWLFTSIAGLACLIVADMYYFDSVDLKNPSSIRDSFVDLRNLKRALLLAPTFAITGALVHFWKASKGIRYWLIVALACSISAELIFHLFYPTIVLAEPLEKLTVEQLLPIFIDWVRMSSNRFFLLLGALFSALQAAILSANEKRGSA